VGKTPGPLGVWLREELTKRGYNLEFRGQSQFARESGVAASIINRILNEDRGAELDVLRRIGQALGYNVGEMLMFAGLVTRDELPPRSPEELQAISDNPYTDPHERQIWEMGELSEFLRTSLIVALRNARDMEGRADARPDADVRQFKRPS
jgi:transcriptional regulator with XRE-family HTH domain